MKPRTFTQKDFQNIRTEIKEGITELVELTKKYAMTHDKDHMFNKVFVSYLTNLYSFWLDFDCLSIVAQKNFPTHSELSKLVGITEGALGALISNHKNKKRFRFFVEQMHIFEIFITSILEDLIQEGDFIKFYENKTVSGEEGPKFIEKIKERDYVPFHRKLRAIEKWCDEDFGKNANGEDLPRFLIHLRNTVHSDGLFKGPEDGNTKYEEFELKKGVIPQCASELMLLSFIRKLVHITEKIILHKKIIKL